MQCKLVCQNLWYTQKYSTIIHLRVNIAIVSVKGNDNRIACINLMISIHCTGARTKSMIKYGAGGYFFLGK